MALQTPGNQEVLGSQREVENVDPFEQTYFSVGFRTTLKGYYFTLIYLILFFLVSPFQLFDIKEWMVSDAKDISNRQHFLANSVKPRRHCKVDSYKSQEIRHAKEITGTSTTSDLPRIQLQADVVNDDSNPFEETDLSFNAAQTATGVLIAALVIFFTFPLSLFGQILASVFFTARILGKIRTKLFAVWFILIVLHLLGFLVGLVTAEYVMSGIHLSSETYFRFLWFEMTVLVGM